MEDTFGEKSTFSFSGNLAWGSQKPCEKDLQVVIRLYFDIGSLKVKCLQGKIFGSYRSGKDNFIKCKLVFIWICI